jgi:hypothetical protein
MIEQLDESREGGKKGEKQNKNIKKSLATM